MILMDKILIKKYINDNVYGGIGLTENEFCLVNTRIFQRLRRIKQQGLTNYIFPSAEHTRFSHSLGVLYIMGKMTERLVCLGEITLAEQKMLRYAALLHDIGHYPLSHLTEAVYRHRAQRKIEADVLADTTTENSQPFAMFAEKLLTRDGHHEAMGACVIQYSEEINMILHRDAVDPKELGLIIQGKSDNVIYHQLMHSSLDADRLDYLLRDSMSAGVKYGLIDLDYLIRLLEVGDFEIVDSEKKMKEKSVKAVGVNEKGIHVLEHYLMARYFAYSQVTMHRTSVEYEVLAQVVINRLADMGKIYKTYEEVVNLIKENINDFIKFDDYYMRAAIESMCDFDLSANEACYQGYISALLEREKLTNFLDEKVIIDEDVEQVSQLDNMARRLSDKNYMDQLETCIGLKQEEIGYTGSSLGVDYSCKELVNENKEIEAAKVVTIDGKCIQLAKSEKSLIKGLFGKKLQSFRVFGIGDLEKEKREINEYLHNTLK